MAKDAAIGAAAGVGGALAGRAAGALLTRAKGGAAAAVGEGETRALSVATSKTGGHSMVGVEAENGSTVWFDQTHASTGMTGSGKLQVGPGTFQNKLNTPKGYQVNSQQVPAAQAANAMSKAKSMVGGNTYNPVTNSCVSCAKEVLKAGGLKPPATTLTPRGLQKFMDK